MLAALILVPALAGAAIWGLALSTGTRSRATITAVAAAALSATLALAVAAATTRATATWAWGAGIDLELAIPPLAAAVAITVPAVALATALYAGAHEPADGLARLVGLLVAFAGAMELVVVAADLLTLAIGWELVAAVSWALIGHEWRDATRPARAAHAFNATRAGGLGLVLAAGAAFAATGGLAYGDLAELDGAALHVVAAGVVLAAAAKSAQLPFAPWLFSAMAGPTPVSALLHSATMVAAGAYLLIRLQPALAPVGWFAPVVIGVGLATALLGGVVALLQQRAKHLLAASTSAQYGLMLVAVGAGYPLVATAHLVAHAAVKSLLFLAVGVAISAAGSEQLNQLRVGSHRRVTAGLAAIAALALAAVPPLGAAWSKEQIAAAATNTHVLAGAATIAAGGLTAWYVTRFHLLAFGRSAADNSRELTHPPRRSEHAAMGGLAVATVGLGVVWLPPVEHALRPLGELPTGAVWEVALSLAVVAAGIYAAVVGERAGWLGSLGAAGPTGQAAQWLGLTTLSRRAVTRPVLGLAATAGRVDDRLVDGGVRGLARLVASAAAGAARADVGVVDAGPRGIAVATRLAARRGARAAELGVDALVGGIAGGFGWSGRDLRRLQSGAAHHYLTIVVVGAAVAVLVAALVG